MNKEIWDFIHRIEMANGPFFSPELNRLHELERKGMTDSNQITITQRDDGVYEARDGCHKWVSKNGIDWLQQDGKPPPLRALRSAMFRHWEGGVPADVRVPLMGLGDLVCEAAVMGGIEGCLPDTDDDPLTTTERIALEGAIKDAKAGLAAGVSVDSGERAGALTNELPKVIRGVQKGRVHVSIASVNNHIWRFGGPDTKQDVVWDARTGERTVLNHKAVSEVEGYTGPIDKWPRDKAYRHKDGSVIVLPSDGGGRAHFIHRGGSVHKLHIDQTVGHWFPIPGSTGRLVPEIKEDDE